MYRYDKNNNCILEVEDIEFSTVGLKERQHLQEWIAKSPNCLGEDLLIIQKEFDGFKDTKERLDLLALDKKGNLVIIENKLDDSGRNVTWQALKYASYCSSLNKDEVISIYQQYLDNLNKIGNIENAVEKISEFFDNKDIKEIQINEGNHSQRIIFVAREFRKEVTSTVMWLANYNLRITCVKVTPYKYGEELFVDFDRIIPIPEAEDYMIKMASKAQLESQVEETITRSGNERANFWRDFIAYDSENNLYKNKKETSEPWLTLPIGNGLEINLGIQKNRVLVCFYMYQGGKKEKNVEMLAFLQKYRAEIDSKIHGLIWEQTSEEKVTRHITKSKELSYLDSENKEKIFKFFIETSKSFKEIFGKKAEEYFNLQN